MPFITVAFAFLKKINPKVILAVVICAAGGYFIWSYVNALSTVDKQKGLIEDYKEAEREYQATIEALQIRMKKAEESRNVVTTEVQKSDAVVERKVEYVHRTLVIEPKTLPEKQQIINTDYQSILWCIEQSTQPVKDETYVDECE